MEVTPPIVSVSTFKNRLLPQKTTLVLTITLQELERYVNYKMPPLHQQINALVKAANDAEKREKDQKVKVLELEVEKTEQEKMIAKMAKTLNIKSLDDDLDMEEEKGGGSVRSKAAKGIQDIKGFDQKSVPTPDKFGKIQEFQERLSICKTYRNYSMIGFCHQKTRTKATLKCCQLYHHQFIEKSKRVNAQNH